MNERCDDSTRRFPWRWGVALVVMLVLYVASFGPAVVAMNELGFYDNPTATRFFAATYYPLGWIELNTGSEMTWLRDYSKWCLHLWNET